MCILPNAAPSCLLTGAAREEALETVVREHYLHRRPAGRVHVFGLGGAIVVMANSANTHATRFLLGDKFVPHRRKHRLACVWDLARLWAPRNHHPNLLTQAISAAVREFKTLEPHVSALLSYADLNAGHHGGVYRAASWTFIGKTEGVRVYADRQGNIIKERPRLQAYRLTRRQLAARGWRTIWLQKRLRFAFGLTKAAKAAIAERFPMLPPRKHPWEIVAGALCEMGRKVVTANDVDLLLNLYDRLGYSGNFGRPQDRVLHTLTRFPGQLVEEWVPGRNGAWASRLVRAFRLPDAVEAQAA